MLKTKPITQPINPNEPHRYVGKNGVRVKRICRDTESPWRTKDDPPAFDVYYENGKGKCVSELGKVFMFENGPHEHDLLEIVEDDISATSVIMEERLNKGADTMEDLHYADNLVHMIFNNVMKDWPNCKTAGCLNKSCRSLNSEMCHPHTIISRSVKIMNPSEPGSSFTITNTGETPLSISLCDKEIVLGKDGKYESLPAKDKNTAKITPPDLSERREKTPNDLDQAMRDYERILRDRHLKEVYDIPEPSVTFDDFLHKILAPFAEQVKKNYDPEIAKKGAEIGTKLRIKYPDDYKPEIPSSIAEMLTTRIEALERKLRPRKWDDVIGKLYNIPRNGGDGIQAAMDLYTWKAEALKILQESE